MLICVKIKQEKAIKDKLVSHIIQNANVTKPSFFAISRWRVIDLSVGLLKAQSSVYVGYDAGWAARVHGHMSKNYLGETNDACGCPKRN